MKKKLALLLIILLATSCKTTNVFKKVSTYDGSKYIGVPVLVINKKEYTKIEDLHFKHSVGGKPIKEETEVMIKYDDKYLEIKFECRNNPRINQNYFTEDNTQMFTQEVFELFISNGGQSPEEYLEIQLNPNNALFLSEIKNTYKSDKKFKNEFIDTKTAGVMHSVVKDIKKKTWSGYIKLPLKMLQYPKLISKNTFRLNFYRIISNENHKDKNWRNNTANSTFACWSSTMAKNPQFHSPDYFGFLILD